MTTKEIYESIDQSKISPKGKDFLQKAEKSTKGFTIENEKLETVMRKIYKDLKERKPEALKNVKVKTVEVTEKVPTTKTERKKDPKKTTKTVKKEVKKASGTKKNPKPTKTPSTPKEGKKEHISTRASKLAKKEGITFKEARAKISKLVKEESKKAEKQTEKELDKLLAFVRKESFEGEEKYPKTYGKQKPDDANLSQDAKRRAKPVGKRVSKNGKTYYEYRDNRSDRNSLPAPKGQYKYKGKTPPFLQAGGTLPTPFGQAGLVGETGAMNEIDLFAMGGDLPQGVHQYYGQTYNPAYPTPHGYAKGGNVPVGFHKMPNGEIMADSEHLAKGGEIDDFVTVFMFGLEKDADDFFEMADKFTDYDVLRLSPFAIQYTGGKDGLDFLYERASNYESNLLDIYAKGGEIDAFIMSYVKGVPEENTNLKVDTQSFTAKLKKGGKLGFDGLAKKVAKRYEGKPVKKQFQNEYGKTYSKAEAMEVGRKVAGKVYREQQSMEKGGEVIEYSKVYEILKDKIDDAVEDIESTYEQATNTKGEEVESKSRDGFIPFTNGGYSSRWFEYSNMLEGSGMNLPTASLDKKIEEFRERNREIGFERFEEEYPEIVKELGGIDNVNYSELEDAGYSNEADDLDMFMEDDEDSIMMEVEAFYYNPNNDRGEGGKHTIQLSGVVNLESPYHRSGNLEDYIEERFTFDSYKELEDKLDKGLAKVVSWFEGDMYDKSPRELKIRRMEAGGTLPTPFGQAGLVGETGAMNEIDLFAMGGDLPQGVHQYYAQTYNPAYPTPHGYAKGGYIEYEKIIPLNEVRKNPKLKREFIEGYYLAVFEKGKQTAIGVIKTPNEIIDGRHLGNVYAEKLKNGKIKIKFGKEYYSKGGMITSKMYDPEIHYQVVVNDDYDNPLYFKTFASAKKYTLANVKNQDNTIISPQGDSIEIEKNQSKKDLDFLFEYSMAKGGKTQGYNDKLDESLGNTKGKRSTKEQNYKDRRNESEAMEKKGGKRKYASVKTMDKGSRKKRKTPMTLAKAIRRDGEKWQDAVKRATIMMKKEK